MTNRNLNSDESQLDSFFSNLEFQIKHRALKRVFDVIFSLGLLLLFIPLYFFIAVAICVSSKGPIVYAHQRIGRGGKKFGCYKFRSMYFDADKRLQAVSYTHLRAHETD